MAKSTKAKGFETTIQDDPEGVAGDPNVIMKDYTILMDGTIINSQHYKSGDVITIEPRYARQLTDAGIYLSEIEMDKSEGETG